MITYQLIRERSKLYARTILDNGSTAASQIYNTVLTMVHSQLPTGNDKNAGSHSRDQCCAIDRSGHKHRGLQAVDCQLRGRNSAPEDTTAAVCHHDTSLCVFKTAFCSQRVMDVIKNRLCLEAARPNGTFGRLRADRLRKSFDRLSAVASC